MVDNLPVNKKNNNRFPFSGVLIDQNNTEKRRIARLLPGVNQTQTLQKFLSAGADHLFEPGSSKPINGYVGQRPSYFDPKQDYYLEESTAVRRFYQLEPSMTSKTTDDGTIDSLLTYDDLINQLRFQGALTNNHHRLFEQEYYTWCPPIDLDKFLNFREYYWLPEGPVATQIFGHVKQSKGDSKTTVFPLPNPGVIREADYSGLSAALVRVFVDDVPVSFTYPAGTDRNFVQLATTPVVGSKVVVAVRSNVLEDIKQAAATSISWGVTITSNLRIQIMNDLDTSLNGKTYIIENVGVGKDPILVEDTVSYSDNADLVLNGGFELPADVPEGSLVTLVKGDTTLQGWSITSGSVDVNNYVQAEEGKHNLDLSGLNPGTIEQYLTTTPGQTYTLSFRMAGNPDGNTKGASLHTVIVTTGDDQNTFVFDSSQQTLQALGWVTKTVVFVAKSTRTLLSFAGVEDNSYGVFLDRISVVRTNVNVDILSATQDYLVMERGARDGNPWSKGNRWFHRTVVGALSDSVDPRTVQAKRPIVEFQRNLELYNYGLDRRPSVHLVSDSVGDIISAVTNRTSLSKDVDGIDVSVDWINENIPDKRLRVLVTGDRNDLINNRVYQITPRSGKLQISLVADGLDVGGAPVHGEVIEVTLGRTYGGKNMFWNGVNWSFTQDKRSENQAPLFQLYDYDGVRFQDPGRYPGSNFAGNRVFGYMDDNTSSRTNDPVLGFPLVHSDKGEIEFQNYLSTDRYTYKSNSADTSIRSYGFHHTQNNGSSAYSNDWYVVPSKSRQMVVDTFEASNGSRLFTLSQSPAAQVDGDLPNLLVRVNSKLLTEGVDFIRQNNQILITSIADGDLVEARTFNPANKDLNTPGQYEVPLNLQANPGSEEVITITKGEAYAHFTEIMRNQRNFQGVEFSSNNWRDTQQVRNLGTGIVQHSAPLLRTMLLASQKNLDLMTASRFVEGEYARFRAKFDQKIMDFIRLGKYREDESVDVWVDAALDSLTRGYTQDFPFYYSGMAATDTRADRNFIPETPSYLGIYPHTTPGTVTENGVVYLVGHDGSRTPAYGDYRDTAILALENRIYNSMSEDILALERPMFDAVDYVSGYYRTADYSVDEYSLLLRAMFERWCATNSVDYKTNLSFNADDPFTWNWSSVRSRDNRMLPGNWRGIYQLFYDTDRPHTHPWEMLGFTDKPIWWDLRYGSAPYTRDNDIMWDDLEAGRIYSGPRETLSDARWARPGLRGCIPVDSQGNLLNPREAGVTANIPTANQSRANWQWGDVGPAEAAWRRSYWFPYAVAQANYLMKPALFVETAWDGTNSIRVGAGTLNSQVISKYSGRREQHTNEYVHAEITPAGEVIKRVGIQQWVSDYLISQGKNVTDNFGKYVRGLDAQLAYKVGGFTDHASLLAVSDSFDRVPSEDVAVELYKSPSVREEFYGGVVVKWTGAAWQIFGFDIVDPVFKVLPPDRNGTSITLTGTGRTQGKIPNWLADTYYSVNATVQYSDHFYRCIRTHTSSKTFEVDFWKEVARPDVGSPFTVEYFLDPLNENYVERLPYGNIIRTPQEMAEFFGGYERYLVSRGWVFDQNVSNQQVVSDWRNSCREFLAWMRTPDLPEGSFIALSPSATRVKFESAHGTVAPVEQIINGVYSILDKNGMPIIPQNTNVIRDNDVIQVVPNNNQQIFACRLYVSEVEHVLVFNNTTIFKDIVYSPLLNIRQPRIRLQGFKTRDWVGRVDAPGFLVTGNTLTPNFEKTADDFRRFFDIEGVENSQLKARARANTGYSEKEYLSNLLMTPTNQFEFYQNVIQQKGTGSAFKRILRSNFIRHNDGLQFLEEWAFRVGDYGAANIRPTLDIKLRQKDVLNNPQLIRFNGVYVDHNRTETASILYSINGIKGARVLAAGKNFQTTPTITTSGGGGTGVKLAARMDWSTSTVTGVTVVKGGAGFVEGDVITLEGSGTGATIVVTDVNYINSVVTSLALALPDDMTSAGAGYKVNDVIFIDGGNGRARGKVTSVDAKGGITGVALVTTGGNYDPNQLGVSFDGFNQSASPYFKVTASGGAIRLVDIVSAGAGYDDKTVCKYPRTTTGAEVTVSVSGGSLASVDVLEPGSGYVTSPKATIIGGTPQEHAEISLIVDNSAVPLDILVKDFAQPGFAQINSVTVEILVPFNGSQPVLSIGDGAANGRYLNGITLAGKTGFKLDLTADNNVVLNADNQVLMYLLNTSTQGSIRIKLSYSNTAAFFAETVEDSQKDNIIDITDVFANSNGEYLYRDDRWVLRYPTQRLDWPTRHRSLKEKGNLPNAGYVHLSDVEWTTANWQQFLNLFRDRQDISPDTFFSESVDLPYVEALLDHPPVKRVTLASGLRDGIFSIVKVNLSITQGYPFEPGATPTVSVGDATDPERFMPKQDATVIQNTDFYINEYIRKGDLVNDSIYVYVDQKTNLNAHPGRIAVSVVLDRIGDSVLPGHRAWCYDTGIGDWSVFRLGDSGLNSLHTYPGSYYGQGTVVATNKNVFDHMGIQHDILNPLSSTAIAEQRMPKVVLNNVENVYPNLQGVYKTKFANRRKIFFDAKSLQNGNGNQQQLTPIMDMFADTGIVINRLTVGVIRAFAADAGRNPTLTIGTVSDPDRYVKALAHNTRTRTDTPTAPTFDYSQPITVQMDTDELLVDEGTAIKLNFIRSGNIFVTPVSIDVTNGGWGYTVDSNPRVVVLGPAGVQAKANITGRVVGYAVVDGGSGYGNNTTMTVVGGGGAGAQGKIVVEDGKIVRVDIPGAGVGQGTVSVANGQVVEATISGTGWQMNPIVRLTGGNPARHATISTKLVNGAVTLDAVLDAGSDYRSAPQVTLQAYTGDGYTGTPRVIVAGGGGAGAQIEPIMVWTVSSITITDWGKCSWTGDAGRVVVEPPKDGAAATAEIVSTPNPNVPSSVRQVRYRVVSPVDHIEYNRWKYVGDTGTETIKFPAPSATNDPDYWLQSVTLPQMYVDGPTTYQVELPEFVYDEPTGQATGVSNFNNAQRGDTYTCYVDVNNTIEGGKDIDLTRIYVKYIDINERVSTDDRMVAAFDPDGVEDGLISVLVDYHYVSGFETYDLQDVPSFSVDNGVGGDILTWDEVRFANRDKLNNPLFAPANGWQLGDLALLDDGRTNTERARPWNDATVFDYHDLTLRLGQTYRSLQGGQGTIVEPVLANGSITSVKLLDGGTQYTRVPEVVVQGTGFGALLKAKLKPTSIAKIVIVSGGKNYTGREKLIIEGDGIAALARVSSVIDGTIMAIDVVSGGKNFTTNTTVRIADDFNTDGDLAVLEVAFVPTDIDSIEVVDGGQLYDACTVTVQPVTTRAPFLAQEWELAAQDVAGWRTVALAARTAVSKEWQEVRREADMVDSDLIESASIYNINTHETEQTLQLYDPFKGAIPGIAEAEIEYILEYDPAVYTNGNGNVHVIDPNQSWGRDQQGLLWWDLSTVRYLNYEMGDFNYKWKNWGKLCPGVSVDVYEWTRSTQPPQNWVVLVRDARANASDSNRATGEVKDAVSPGYCVREEFNSDLGRDETVYYFWVKNVTTVPGNLEQRTLSSTQVANVIADPTNNDIAWFAVIESNKVIVGGIKQYLNDTDTVLKVKWKQGHNDGNYHKQWVILREGDERNNIDLRLWNKMRDSLVGWDANVTHNTVRTTTTTALAADGGTITVADASQLTTFGEVNILDVWFSYEYIHGNTLYGVQNPGNLQIKAGAELYQEQNISDPKLVPGEWLSETESYGNEVRPRQTWFKQDKDSKGLPRPSRDARKIFVDTLNKIFSREPVLDTRYEWRDLFAVSENVPDASQYSYEAPDLFYRDQLVATNTIKPGQRVFLNGLDDTLGFWTLWRYEPDQPDSDGAGYVLERAQRWRMQKDELWEAVDWYADGWSANDFPVRRFVDRAARDAAGRLDVTLLKGTLVRCDRVDATDDRWLWSVFTDNGWQDVAKGSSTIRLKDAFWSDISVLYGFNNFYLNRIGQRDGSWEISFLINTMQTKFLTSLERNELFFSMVQAAQSQHTFVDWSFKTSFLYLAGYKEELNQSPIAHKDQIGNLLDFVEEIKPYHVKVRDFVRRLATPIDVANLHVTDFDKPLYYDKTLNGGVGAWRRLNPLNAVDQQIIATQLPFSDWWNNYTKTNYDLSQWDETWNPIRRPSIKILLDRVSCKPVVGWDPFEMPWDATEERWISNGELRSFAVLADKYRKAPRTVAEWKSFYKDYKVVVVDPKSKPEYLFVDTRGTDKTSDDTSRINFERMLWDNSSTVGTVVVIADAADATLAYSAWRCIKSPEDINELTYRDEFLVNFHEYFEMFNYRFITVLDEEARDDALRASQKGVNSGLAATIQTGDLVTLINSEENFVWTGETWEVFWSLKWDMNYGGGLADRIDRYYEPDATQKRKELNELIRGCDFRGSIVEGGNMEQGLWDMFAWDFEGGWANEFDYYVGRDVDLNNSADSVEQQAYDLYKGETNWSIDDSTGKEAIKLPEGVQVYEADQYGNYQLIADAIVYRRTTSDQYGVEISDPEDVRALFYMYDVDSNGVYVRNTDGTRKQTLDDSGKPKMVIQSLAKSNDIVLEGSDFVQPWFEGGHPDELIKMRIRNPMTVSVFQKTGGTSTQNTAFRINKDGTDSWLAGYLTANGLTLAKDLTPFDREIVVSMPNGVDLMSSSNSMLLNPMDPQDAVFEKLQSSWVYHYAQKDSNGMDISRSASAGDWSITYTIEDILGLFSNDINGTKLLKKESFDSEVRRVTALLEADFYASSTNTVWISALDSSRIVRADDLVDVTKVAGKMRGSVSGFVQNADYSVTITISVAADGVREQGTAVHWGVIPESKISEPGAIWVDDEKIKYRRMEAGTQPGTVVLSALTRGADGTSYAPRVGFYDVDAAGKPTYVDALKVVHKAGTAVYDASVLHRLSLGDADRYPVEELASQLVSRREGWAAIMNGDVSGPLDAPSINKNR